MALKLERGSGANAFRAPKLQRPRPRAGVRWRDEIDLAVTTLPSVSFRVGDAPVTATNDPKGWVDLQAGTARFRHDLAYRDAHYAFAALPPPDNSATDVPLPADERFSPLPGNGPADVGCQTNGWDDVRLSMNRRAALAALDDRDMVAANRLTGVFGDAGFDLAAEPVIEI